MIQLIQTFGSACAGGDFFGFPKWYKYLNGVISYPDKVADPKHSICSPQLSGLNDVYLILAAVIETLLRVGTIMAVGFVIYGGIQYIVSQGEPDKTNKARGTIINALVGLVISLTAAATVSFFAGRIHSP